jgi:two-component system, OmpR family, KDP operon response regulator KdpE
MTVNPIPPRNQRRVLVIEDDLSVRRMLRFSLREAGFEITEASNGAEALRSLQAQVPEAVILDLGLPDGLGGAVLEWLHRSPGAATGSPAWVVVSALDQHDVARQYGPLGRRFLAKPFNPWDLLTRIQELMDVRSDP